MRDAPPPDRRFGLADLLAFGGLVMLVVRFASAAREPAAVVSPVQAASAPVGSTSTGEAGAAEGRGRGARYPWEIPWAGWRDILWRTYAEVGKDRMLAVAAGVVFYGLLAVFPAISAFVSIYGLFANPDTAEKTVSLLGEIIPPEAMGPIAEQVDRVASSGNSSLGFAFLVSLGLALWSANAGTKAVIDALNVAYGEREERGFVRLTLISLTLTLGMILAGVCAVAAIVVFPVATSFLGLESLAAALVQWLRWPLLLVILLLGLAILYRFGPNRTKARWQWLSVGSVVAAVLWLAGSAALSLYLSRFSDYDAAYGSLAAGIGLMMWLWLSAIVILLGAELNAEIEHQTARDSTVGPEKPLGSRGATMADTIGAAQP